MKARVYTFRFGTRKTKRSLKYKSLCDANLTEPRRDKTEPKSKRSVARLRQKRAETPYQMHICLLLIFTCRKKPISYRTFRLRSIGRAARFEGLWSRARPSTGFKPITPRLVYGKIVQAILL